MTEKAYVAWIAKHNRSNECPECYGEVDKHAKCLKCGVESDKASRQHLRELVDDWIDEARKSL